MWTWISQTELGEEWSHKWIENLKYRMHWCEYHYAVVIPMKNMDWARIFGTWKSTRNHTTLPPESDDDEVHYVVNLNNYRASFYCMYFFNIVRHHIIFISNTKRPISSLFFSEVLQKKVLSEVSLFQSPSHWNACAHFKLEHCLWVNIWIVPKAHCKSTWSCGFYGLPEMLQKRLDGFFSFCQIPLGVGGRMTPWNWIPMVPPHTYCISHPQLDFIEHSCKLSTSDGGDFWAY